MKKLLSIILASSMVLGSFGFAMADTKTDVEGTKYEDSVARLSALDILNGYEDGTFRPEKTITRAEFAKIMTTTLGVGEAAKYAGGDAKFNDVPANHWAAGYVNLAADLGLINGYGDGNFGPSDEVTYAQAITMVVRGLGYEPKAKALGGYPSGYIAVAIDHEITDDITVINAKAATRGDVALMVDNSLEVPMMVQTSFGNNPDWKEDSDKTILKSKHDIEKFTGNITVTAKVDDSLEKGEFKFTSSDGKVSGTYDLMADVDVVELIGMEVTIWANDDNEVFLLDLETDLEDIVIDTITKVTDDKITVDGDEYDLHKDVNVLLNFDEKANIDTLKDVTSTLYGFVILNSDDEVVTINAIDAAIVDDGVVTSVSDKKIEYVEVNTGDIEEIEFDDYKDGVVFLNDVLMRLEDDEKIEANSFIDAFEAKEDDKLYIVVSNEREAGELSRVSNDEVTVNDVKIDIADTLVYSSDNSDNFKKFADMADLDDLNGEEVTAILDLSGDVVTIIGDVKETSSTQYGIVTYGEQKSTSEVTVFNKDGEEVSYKFEDRNEGTAADGLKYFEKGNNLTFGIMKYKLNTDGKIAEDNNSFITVDMSDNSIAKSGKSVDAVSGEITKADGKDFFYVNKGLSDEAKYYVTKDTVIMKAVDGGALDPELLTLDSIKDSKISKDGDAIIIGEANKDADMIVFINSAFEGINQDSYYGIVTDSAAKAGGDYIITVDIAGEGEKEVVIKSSDADDLKEGTVLEFKYDNKGKLVIESNSATLVDNTSLTVDYDGGYLKVAGAYVKVANDVVVYKMDKYTTNAGKLEGISLDGETKITKVENYKTIQYITDDDDKVIVVLVGDEK